MRKTDSPDEIFGGEQKKYSNIFAIYRILK